MGKEYLNNKELERIIKTFKEAQDAKITGVRLEEMKKELSMAFYILAGNIIGAFNFNLVDQEDALQEGVMICFEKLHRFDPSIGKAFNFCTTIILNHYRQLYRSAKNYKEFKIKYHNHLCDKMTADTAKGRDRRNFEYKKIDKEEGDFS